MAGDRTHGHEEGLCQFIIAGTGGFAPRSIGRAFVLLSRAQWGSVEGDLARRTRRLPVHKAIGERTFFVAVGGRRGGNNLDGPTGLSALRN